MINIIFSYSIHLVVQLNIIWTLVYLKIISSVNMEIETTFNFIYIMHYNGLMVVLHLFNYQSGTWVEPFNFNMLKLLFKSCILHLLKYIETHATQCFAIKLEVFNDFFHASWIINICTWVESCSLWIYWNHYSNVAYCIY
jgi:hypothetical protein